MLNVTEAQFDRIFQVNVKSIYLSAMHCVPVFRRQGVGCFVNIASTAGVRPRPGLTWYNGSKGAAILLSKSMAVELAPEKIRVNAVNPVIGKTALLTTFMLGRHPGEPRQIRGIDSPGPPEPAGRHCQRRPLPRRPSRGVYHRSLPDVDGGRCV